MNQGKLLSDCTVINHLWSGDGGHIILCPPCSALFPDVVNCMQTDNLELKKLVYLYLMNYAKSQPDMAIMAVNTFVKVRLCHQQKILVKQEIILRFDTMF